MNRNRRPLMGLVLLIAMTASIAEIAVAAMCAPIRSVTHAEAAMAGMPQPTDHDCPNDHEHAPPQGGERGSDCPFSPAGVVQACAASASLPATGIGTLASSDGNVKDLPQTQVEPQVLFGSALFHPPRA